MIAMRKTKKKMAVKALTKMDEVGACVRALQELEINRDGILNTIEEEIADIRSSHDQEMFLVTTNIEYHRAQLTLYLKDHKPEFKEKKRSIQFAAGTIGWRLGQPRLKPLAKWTWEKVLNAILDLGGKAYCRTQVKVDKDMILADADDIGVEGLKTYGLRVVQDDKLYIDINRETPEGQVNGS